MAQSKALFILHYSPPVHGASKVGDSIKNSKIINQSLNTKYVKIKSSHTINDIGKFHASKMGYALDLFFRVCYYIVFFRPQIIYYTSSPSGFAFYRDFIVSIPIKIYSKINACHIFYHYHSKGINSFVANSNFSKKLTNFFLKGVNIILISKQMESELSLVSGYKQVYILKNGVADMLNNSTFNKIIDLRIKEDKFNVLYLSNLMKDKGYDTALELVNKLKNSNFENFTFHFAGSWSSKDDELFFNNYV
jgi:glycosyltransferase involved in cell wall biosynthesis